MPNRIRERRQAAGMALQEVAAKVGTTAVTISRWEREPKRVTLPVLESLAAALGCSQGDLIASPQDVPPENATHLTSEGMAALRSFYGIDVSRIGMMEVATDMMRPTFCQGDQCFYDKAVTWVDNAGVYAILLNGEARLVRAHRNLEGGIRVTCDNPLYAVDFTWSDDRLEVIGKVIGHHRKI